jgi:hypothetical protein
MYVVIDKRTQEIIHINPAPPSQHLKGKDVYFDYDPETMQIGEADVPQVPEHFVVSADGLLREFTLQEKHAAGLITLRPVEKIVDNQIVIKSLSEQVEEGILKLAPTEKIVGDAAEERIAVKSLSEQVGEGILTLAPTAKVVGEGVHEQIVTKSLSEQVADGLLELSPTQKIVGEGRSERVVEKTLSEKLAEGLIQLDPTEKIVGEGPGEEVVKRTKQELLDAGILTLEDIQEDAVRRLRAEVNSFYEEHRTPNNYRLDQLARQKVSFSYQFLNAPKTSKAKQELLSKRLIYPDSILEEIVREIEKVQQAYNGAVAAVQNAVQNQAPVATLEAISLQSFVGNQEVRDS